MNSTKSDLSVDYNDEEQYFDDGINPFDSEVILLLSLIWRRWHSNISIMFQAFLNIQHRNIVQVYNDENGGVHFTIKSVLQ